MRTIEVVQQMIEWIEANMEDTPTLQKVSDAVGYSPWYCSEMFHDITGFTMKSYIAGRRLARITEEIRDTKERILDIAIKYGFSSQEALTRVFKEQYGCTPAAYRKKNKPVPMTVHKHVLFPNYDEKRIKTMEETRLAVRVEHILAHKYLGIWEEKADNYCDFWKYHDCDEVCGFVTSMDKMAHPIVTAHTAGWKLQNGKKTYFYGTGVPLDYSGEVPRGFTVKEFPAGDYLVFSYPVFDFMTENADVMGAVEQLAFSFDPAELGYEWNDEECQIYQRHYPEKLGYQVVRPVKKIKN